MKSAGCCGIHAQLQRKLPQYLRHMQLYTHILLQTIRKDHFYLFFLGDHQGFCFTIKICRLHFLMNLFECFEDNARDPCYQDRKAKMY